MTKLIEALLDNDEREQIIQWACPVPFFGPISTARIATVGINPSSREFVDRSGRELQDQDRRLPTLRSLELECWSKTSGAQVCDITRSCERYFTSNPYRQWFDVLDRVLNAAGVSYYGAGVACHIDLVAFATRRKWGHLDSGLKRNLIVQGRQPMAEFVRASAIRVLILNGRSVVREFETFTGEQLSATVVDDWTLPRSSGRGVPGVAYEARINSIGGMDLDREVLVVGFNHNLQSSYGVTAQVVKRIGHRIGEEIATTID